MRHRSYPRSHASNSLFDFPTHSKISDFEVPFLIHKDVRRLNISVNHFLLFMQVLKTSQHLKSHQPNNIFRNTLRRFNNLVERTQIHIFQSNMDIRHFQECSIGLDNVGAIALVKGLQLEKKLFLDGIFRVDRDRLKRDPRLGRCMKILFHYTRSSLS